MAATLNYIFGDTGGRSGSIIEDACGDYHAAYETETSQPASGYLIEENNSASQGAEENPICITAIVKTRGNG